MKAADDYIFLIAFTGFLALVSLSFGLGLLFNSVALGLLLFGAVMAGVSAAMFFLVTGRS